MSTAFSRACLTVLLLAPLAFAACASSRSATTDDPYAARRAAVPNEEARPFDGLQLRSLEPAYRPGETVRFELSFERTEEGVERSPEYGVTCLWRLERWSDSAWTTTPRAVWGRPEDEACILPALSFQEPGRRPEHFALSATAEAGPYRWCLEPIKQADEVTERRVLCSNTFFVEPE